MIALLLLTLTSQPIGAQPACRLAAARHPVDKIYLVRGTYFTDGHHGAEIDRPKCGDSIPAYLGGAAGTVGEYQQAYDAKCNANLAGYAIAGAFTGRFVSRRIRLLGKWQRLEFFQIDAIKSKDMDSSSITCLK